MEKETVFIICFRERAKNLEKENGFSLAFEKGYNIKCFRCRTNVAPDPESRLVNTRRLSVRVNLAFGHLNNGYNIINMNKLARLIDKIKYE